MDDTSPYLNLAQTSSSTPRQLALEPAQDSNEQSKSYQINEFMDLVTSKMNEVMDAQANHAKKIMKENAVFRRKLLDAVLEGENSESVKKMKKAIKAKRADGKPLMFEGQDLMSIKPQSDEPRLFGRLVAPIIFGAEN